MSSAGEKLLRDMIDRALAPLEAHTIDPRIEGLEALAKEAALRVFVSLYPVSEAQDDRLAAIAIAAGEAFARAWDARHKCKATAKRGRE